MEAENVKYVFILCYTGIIWLMIIQISSPTIYMLQIFRNNNTSSIRTSDFILEVENLGACFICATAKGENVPT